MKKTLVVLGIIIAVILAVVLALLFAISRRTGNTSGPPTTIALPAPGAGINIFEGSVDLKNIAFLNPAGFAERTFVAVPEVYVAVDTATLTGTGVKRFHEIRIDIAQVTAIRRKDLKYNFEWILHQRKAQKKTEEEAKKHKQKIRIDRLHLKFGRIVFMDYTVRGDKPLMIRFDVNMDETYTGIDDLEKLGKKVSKKFIDKITVGDIQNFELKDLPDIARSALAAIPDETKDRVFGRGKDRNRVLKELGQRLTNKIKGFKK